MPFLAPCGKLEGPYHPVDSFRNRLETRDNVIFRGIYLSHLQLQSDDMILET